MVRGERAPRAPMLPVVLVLLGVLGVVVAVALGRANRSDALLRQHVVREVRRVLGTKATPADVECVYFTVLVHVLRVDAAAAAAAELGRRAPSGELTWEQLNHIVTTLITAGRYEEALGVVEATPASARARAVRDQDLDYGLLELNLAEADMNLGRTEAALARLDALAPAFVASPHGASALAMQRAWILGTLGRGAEAVSAIAGSSPDPLGPRYAAEHHLSHAYALFAAGRHDEADAEIARALDRAERPASNRNALFLRARIAAARGDLAPALEWCREAVEHPHRWQGGDGLLFWGELLARGGDREGARRAWSLALLRDPESVSARTARERLAAAA
ncbi:MAG: tetratricopeptide repeat protein [Myxococcales bacterium]|nr:tetratricopeptide repeat protein [Myxococcales bacterium]